MLMHKVELLAEAFNLNSLKLNIENGYMYL